MIIITSATDIILSDSVVHFRGKVIFYEIMVTTEVLSTYSILYFMNVIIIYEFSVLFLLCYA